MDNAASPLDCSLSIQERWACPFIPTYRAVLRKGKKLHDTYLHGLFIAYYDCFSCSFGELANPEDIESIHAWKNRVLENLARLMLHVYKQMNPTEFCVLQHSLVDTPATMPHSPLVRSIEPTVDRDAVTGATEPTSSSLKPTQPLKPESRRNIRSLRAVPPVDGSGNTAILGAGEATSGSAKKFAGPPKLTSIRKIPKPEENEPVISNVLKVKKVVNNKSIEDSL
ncbi:hypothetical protein F5146DRAFT_1002586 [Armillaria mellea]|nr:hypothetical protein F5146DRAFT_1002586 [Armillaria mellea]